MNVDIGFLLYVMADYSSPNVGFLGTHWSSSPMMSMSVISRASRFGFGSDCVLYFGFLRINLLGFIGSGLMFMYCVCVCVCVKWEVCVILYCFFLLYIL